MALGAVADRRTNAKLVEVAGALLPSAALTPMPSVIFPLLLSEPWSVVLDPTLIPST